MLTVLSVKSKPRYDAAYVNRLQRMVRDHLTEPHRFVCQRRDLGHRCTGKREQHNQRESAALRSCEPVSAPLM